MILAGGLGTRLKSVLNDKPKCLAPINGKLFIDILLDYCIKQGFKRFILCVGYLKEQTIEYLNNRSDCEIIFSEEDEPLGTAGAIKNAEPFLKSDPILIMNGDSFIDANLNNFIDWHLRIRSDVSILLTETLNVNHYGSVKIDNEGNILGFYEKHDSPESGVINAGVYLFNKALLNRIPQGLYYSFEKQFFPSLVNNTLKGYICKEELIDIGTPKRLKLFTNKMKTWE